MNEFILYSYFRSSASHRVRIALNLKDIDFEYRAVHLLKDGGEQHSDEYRELNPSGQVPTLIHKGRAIGQSMAIVDYLDQIRPEPRLFPEDPFQRALVIQFCEIINSGMQPLQNLSVLQELEKRHGADQDQKNEWVTHWVKKGFETAENFLKTRAGQFCFGQDVTAADCFLIPQIMGGADRYNVSLDPYPTIARIRRNCDALEAFQKAAPSAQPDTPSAT
jgi:maleylacetoacetate isomerase